MALLKTTVVGAWPKPAYIKMDDWFNLQNSADFLPVSKDTVGGCSSGHQVDKGLKEVLEKQAVLGLDVITDGEITRENYFFHFLRHLGGVDMDHYRKKLIRAGACFLNAPMVTGRLTSLSPGWCAREWIHTNNMVVSSSTKRKPDLKYTLPGPMTMVDGLYNEYYGEAERAVMRRDLVKAINEEIQYLAQAGCKFIQVDEPALMRYPDEAEAYGVDNVDKCFQGVDDSVTSIVHLCCGYPGYLDQENYAKADKRGYIRLAPLLDKTSIKQVSLEDAETRNDLAALLPLFQRMTVILGSVRIARSLVESGEDIAARVKEALRYIQAERLILAPDCGLGFLTDEMIEAKLKNMVSAARSIKASV